MAKKKSKREQRSKVKKFKPVEQDKVQVKAHERAKKQDQARIRQAVHGTSALNEARKGVNILTGREIPVPKEPKIISVHQRGNR